MSAGTILHVMIVEEVPGYEPHWYIRLQECVGDSPKFNKHEGAVKFCTAMGWTYDTEYFEP